MAYHRGRDRPGLGWGVPQPGSEGHRELAWSAAGGRQIPQVGLARQTGELRSVRQLLHLWGGGGSVLVRAREGFRGDPARAQTEIQRLPLPSLLAERADIGASALRLVTPICLSRHRRLAAAGLPCYAGAVSMAKTRSYSAMAWGPRRSAMRRKASRRKSHSFERGICSPTLLVRLRYGGKICEWKRNLRPCSSTRTHRARSDRSSRPNR